MDKICLPLRLLLMEGILAEEFDIFFVAAPISRDMMRICGGKCRKYF